MELKYPQMLREQEKSGSSNRTFMELKSENVFIKQLLLKF